MKVHIKFYFVSLFLLMSMFAFAQKNWTVDNIPNTRLKGNDIHVSDPDNLLSDTCEMRINTALCSIRDKADVFVVALNSIGDADESQFAAELFNLWGIGCSETNNGVLLLFAEQQRMLKFEIGYGVEATLTDLRCQEIFNNTIAPYFKQGDYEDGLCAGVAEIVNVFGGSIPDGLVTSLPKEEKTFKSVISKYGITWAYVILALMLMLLPCVALVVLISNENEHTASRLLLHLDKTIEGVPYYAERPLKWSGNAWEGKGCLRALLTGFSLVLCIGVSVFALVSCCVEPNKPRFSVLVLLMSIFLYLTWICLRHNIKTLKIAKRWALTSNFPKSVYVSAYDYSLTKVTLCLAPWIAWIFRMKYKKMIDGSIEYRCPECYAAMEEDSQYVLPKAQQLESELNVFIYKKLRCSNGHIIVTTMPGFDNSIYSICPDCSAQTVKIVDSKIVKEATTTKKGLRHKECKCMSCGKETSVEEEIPMIYTYHSSGSSGSVHSSSSHSSSHSSSRGSFGGGRSGGGGFSGRW